MKIAIDCRSLRKKPAGVPNFLIHFINVMVEKRPDWKLLLLTNAPFDEEVNARLRLSSTVQVLVAPTRLLPGLAIWWYLVKVPRLLRTLQPDWFYTPIPNMPFFIPTRVRTLITIHDMVYKQFPETMSRVNWWINWLLHDRSIQSADVVWTVSQYTKALVIQYFPNRKSSEIIVGSGVDHHMFAPSALDEGERSRIREKYKVDKQSLLFVGTLEPRKNLSFLVSLMPQLSQHGLRLVVVGASGWGKALPTGVQPSTIHFTGFIPTQDLIKLYQCCGAFVSTALNEGFGLPQLEAMSCGCPVVCAANSGMEEVVGGAGVTVSEWSAEVWIASILEAIQNRDRYIQAGLERAVHYRWEKVLERVSAKITGN